MSTNDAIEWIDPGHDDLLPLVPRAWMHNQMEFFKARILSWREDQRQDHRLRGYAKGNTWTGDVDVGSGWMGLSIITADGEIDFHRDPDFDRYGYLLILRPAGYSVTGLRTWRGKDVQPKGTLMCFHQRRRLHALVRTGSTRRAMMEDRRHEGVFGSTLYADRPFRIWMSLGLNSPKLLSPEEAAAEMRRKLEKLPANHISRLPRVRLMDEDEDLLTG